MPSQEVNTTTGNGVVKGLFVLVLVAVTAGLWAWRGSNAVPASEPVLRVAVPPNPNAIPLFVMLDKHPDMRVEIVPVAGVPELVAAVQGGDADVALFFGASGAKLYNKGKLPPMQLVNINVWKGLTLVLSNGAASLEDLRGEVIYVNFRGGAPDLILRAILRSRGYDPDADFKLTYLPSSQIIQMMSSQEGAAFISEPQASMLYQKLQNQQKANAASEGHQIVAISFDVRPEEATWADGTMPLGGVFVSQSAMQEKAEAIQSFLDAYADASGYVMDFPDEAAAIASAGFKAVYGVTIPADALAMAIKDGRLAFDSVPVTDIRPGLDAFLRDVIGKAPDDAFYYAPSASNDAK